MRWMYLLALIITLATSLANTALAAPGEDPRFEAMLAKLPKPTEVVGSQPSDWRLKNGTAEIGKMSTVDVQGMPFTKAIRMQSLKRTDRDYMFQAVTVTTAPITVDDALLLTFYARAVELNNDTNTALVNVKLFSMKGVGNAPTASVNVTTDWQKFYFRSSVFSKTVKEFAPGELSLTIAQGLPPQIVEVADIRVYKYPQGVASSDLPHMEVKYEGHEPDAPWRKEAADRIEKIRKGDLAVQVVDAAGKPVTGAEVKVQMKRHAFGWGSAYADPRFDPASSLYKGEDSKRYREEFVKLFNVCTSESGLKWEPWLENRAQALTAAKWVRDHNIPLRGHTLVWCNLDRLPYAMKDQQKQAYYRTHLDELQKLQMDHIHDEMTAMKGQCFEWDLINEPMSHWDYKNLMGMKCYLDYFKLAHEIDPNTRLIVNENKLLSSDGGLGRIAFSREEDFYQFLKYLKDNGAPLAGIGIQAHGGGGVTPPARMLQQLDRFAEFGSISITEFDMVSNDEKFAADQVRDFMTMCFSHPAINTFVLWGFWDGQHYRKNAVIFRKDWSLKPSGEVYMDLVFKQWWTNAVGTTGADGMYKTRGFLGDYEISVTRAGKTTTQPLKLTREGGSVRVVVP